MADLKLIFQILLHVYKDTTLSWYICCRRQLSSTMKEYARSPYQMMFMSFKSNTTDNTSES